MKSTRSFSPRFSCGRDHPNCDSGPQTSARWQDQRSQVPIFTGSTMERSVAMAERAAR